MMVEIPSPAPFASDRFLAALAAEGPLEPARSDRLKRWCERAAVLAWFEPYMIGAPDPEQLLDDEDWIALIADCEVTRTAQDGRRRRLMLPRRREALAGLGGRNGLQQALRETRDRPKQDPLQQQLDRLIEGPPIDLPALQQPDLYALHTVSTWLQGLLDGVPDPGMVALQLRREELLQPHRILASSFVGRVDELDELRTYVQEVRRARTRNRIRGAFSNIARRLLDWPPLVISGPGGVGKSTLVAQFVLEHAATGLVFVDLDFGRPNLDPRRPAALLAEAARQIATQVPSELSAGDALAAELEQVAASTTQGALESQRAVGFDEVVERFTNFARKALPSDRNVPFVLDTFEEVEALGQTRVEGMWDLLRRLQSQLPQLRPVICSRIPPSESYQFLNLRLDQLEPEPAESYLSSRLRTRHQRDLPPPVLAATVRRITRSPLALNLAAELLAQAVDAGKDPDGVVAEIQSQADEAFLYRRILEQIDEEDVRRLATPGLAVRRLDAGVVLKVLAEPCGVTVTNLQDAKKLLQKLARYAALVEPQPDGSLVHRSDVRRQMLKAIEDREGTELVRRIDRDAADYYARDDVTMPPVTKSVATTERAYHLLRLGDITAAEPLLTDDVAQRLRIALDELAPDARLELAVRLKITLSKEELEAADQVRWERGAVQAAQDYLASGDYQRVLSLLQDAPERRRGGPLDRIQAEALIGMGDWERARYVVDEGLAAAQRDGERAAALELSLISARIGFATGEFEHAAAILATAEALTTAADSPDTRLRVLTARIRSARLRQDTSAVEEIARRALAILDPATLAQLSPSVLRELAGEVAPERGMLGDAAGGILRAALRRLGIEQKTGPLIDGLAAAISTWLATGGRDATDVLRILAGIQGAPPLPTSLDDQQAWRKWLEVIPGILLGHAMAALLKLPSAGPSEPHLRQIQLLLASYMSSVARAAGRRERAA